MLIELSPRRIVGSLFAACLVLTALWGIADCLSQVKAKPAKPAKKDRKPVDNSECLICHQDFEEEFIAAKHAKKGVGCVKCHGPSEDHGGDELNVLLPDILYGRSEITPLCKGCHEKDHPKGEEYQSFVKKWTDKYRPNGRMIRKGSICTDCHGNHAILSPGQQQQLPLQ